jgi:hypothetical protein
MTSTTAHVSPVLEIVSELLTNQSIPALDGDQMASLSEYLYRCADKPLRIQIAEIAYRNHDDPQAFELFLACTIPLAQKMAQRKAYKIFGLPTDWQLECMYDGSVSALLKMFQGHSPLYSMPDAFRRYLLTTIAKGALRDYFKREEHFGIRGVQDLAAIAARQNLFRDPVSQDMLTRRVLEEVINFPHLRDDQRAVLQTIAALGPDAALKEHAFTNSGDPDKWTRQRRSRPILNPDAIAEAMQVRKRDVHRLLRDARVILRDVFNRDGQLFLTH